LSVSVWLATDRDVYKKGDVLVGRVTLITKEITEVYCEVKWIDAYNRVVKSIKFKEPLPDSRHIEFKFSLEDSLTMKNTIECNIYDTSGNLLFKTNKTFIVTPPPEPWDDYVVLIWNPGRTKEYLEKIKSLGINAGMAHSPTPRLENLLDTNLRFYLAQIAPRWLAFYHQTGRRRFEWQPLREAYRKTRDKRLLIRKHCLNDPVVAAAYKSRVQDIVERHKAYAPLFYDMADETGIGDLVGPLDLCFCPHCMIKMREWLRSVYGDLENLNREWGTDFKSWDEVTPMTIDEVRERGDYNLAPWADHRTFMEITLAEAFRVCRDWIREIDSSRPIGFTGGQMPSPYGGYDWWRLTRDVDFIEAYNIGESREVIRSFGDGRIIHMSTLFPIGDEAKWMLWYHMLHGDKGVILWDYDEGVGKRYVIEPSLEINPEGLKMKDVFLELRGGITKLLNLSKFEDDKIAIHYSQSSIHAHWALETEGIDITTRSNTAEETQSEFVKLRGSVVKLIEDLGLQYRFISYEEIERGDLVNKGYKVFIMPKSIALSEKEAERIKEFVEAGGVVIADGLPGLMDEHCKKLEKGLLDDLFGLKRREIKLKVGKKAPGVKVKSDWQTLSLKKYDSLNIPVLEEGLEEDGATSLCEGTNSEKAFFVRKVGNGTAIYLNMDLTDYSTIRLNGDGEDYRKLFREILGFVGIKPAIEVIDANTGSNVYGIEVLRWRNRESLYVALIKNPGIRLLSEASGVFKEESRVKLKLPGEFHIYNMRSGEYMGFSTEVEVTVPVYEPVILALTPYRVNGLTVWVNRQLKPGEKAYVKASVSRTPENLNDVVFRLEVYNPEGKIVDYYSGNYIAIEGKAEITIPLALNDPEGAWKVKVKDVETGVEAEATFNLIK